MTLRWLDRLRRPAAPPLDDGEVARLFGEPLLAWLDGAQRTALLTRAGEFLRHRSVVGVQGFTVDAAARTRIAVQASLPLLVHGLAASGDWHSVVVYPGDYVADDSWEDEFGIVHEATEPRSGETWEAGGVVISWSTLVDPDEATYGNVLVHEIAHRLDLANGDANGFPVLPRGIDRRHWSRVFAAAFADLEARIAAGAGLPVDAYAAEDPAEFFAVASEAFFVGVPGLARAWPELHALLVAYYGLAPPVRDPG